MHLRVRGEVDDEVDVRVLDAVDASAKGRVVPGQVLEQVRELVRPRVLALVDAEHVVAVTLEPQGEIRPDLTGRARHEDLHGATPFKGSLLNGREGYRAHRANLVSDSKRDQSATIRQSLRPGERSGPPGIDRKERRGSCSSDSPSGHGRSSFWHRTRPER